MARRSSMARKRLAAEVSPQPSRFLICCQLAGAVALFEGEDVGGLADPAVGVQGFDGLGAEALDVEGAAGDEVLELFDLLGRADQGAGAVGGGLALLAHDVGAADRAVGRVAVGLGAAGMGEVDVLDLGDDVTGAVDFHPVADADVAAVAERISLRVAAGDVVGVVQRGVADDDAADGDGEQARDRGEGAGAADLDVDGLEHGGGALGGELVGEGPARRGRAEAEAGLQVEAVDLVDDAVDVIAERRALALDAAVLGQHLVGGGAGDGQRVGLEAEGGEAGDGGGLGVGEGFGRLAPGVGEEAERAGGGDLRVELAERAGGGVAGVGEGAAGGLGLAGVEGLEVGVAHVDLAADFEDRGRVVEGVRDVVDGAGVLR